jgi:RNA polymerase sigma-70 factor (ECF subfamily)
MVLVELLQTLQSDDQIAGLRGPVLGSIGSISRSIPGKLPRLEQSAIVFKQDLRGAWRTAIAAMNSEEEQITVLLQRLSTGDRQAETELLPLVYGQLHRLAERQFRSERACRTLEPTALINELYLRIIRNTAIEWQSRAHFYAVAAATIRRILVDHARAANAARRPRPNQRVELDEALIYSDDHAPEILIIDEALNKLKAWDARQASIVELRFFAGLSLEETAQTLGISDRTVKRDWTLARAWLANLLNAGEAHSPR